jgi:hypothetical protein
MIIANRRVLMLCVALQDRQLCREKLCQKKGTLRSLLKCITIGEMGDGACIYTQHTNE